MANRRGPVGRGYMPKGGVRAAQASNESWRERQSVPPLPVAEPPTLPTSAPKVDPAGARQRAGRALSTHTLACIGAASGPAALLVAVVTGVAR